MADKQISIIVVEVHTVALAILPHLALGALALTRPIAVTELLEAVLPHIPKVVAVDVALREVGTYTRAARNIAIDTYRGDAEARVALEGRLTSLQLVATEEALAAIRYANAPLAAAIVDKLHKVGKLLVVELQRAILSSTANGEDGKNAPVAHTEAIQKLLKLAEARQ